MITKIKLITTPKGGKEGGDRLARLNQLIGLIMAKQGAPLSSIVSLEDQKGLLTVTHHRRLSREAKGMIEHIWETYFFEPNIEFKINK